MGIAPSDHDEPLSTGMMKALMGDSDSGRFRGPIGAVLEVAGGKGMVGMDIYIVTGPNQSVRSRPSTLAAEPGPSRRSPTNPTGDVRRRTSVVTQPRHPSPTSFESTLAHEYFHVLEMRNAWLRPRCLPVSQHHDHVPGPREAGALVRGGLGDLGRARMGAAGPPAARPIRASRPSSVAGLAGRYGARQRVPTRTCGPLFMEQESGRGATVVTDAWKAIAGRSGWTDVQAAIDGQMSFDTKFREFAVRLWNEQLPGMPINPLFRHGGLDPSFPPTRPDEVGSDARYVDEAIFAIDRQFTDSVDIPEMWALYYRVRVPAEAKRITFNFAGIAPNPKLDIDALVKIKGRDWERRQLDTVTEWCLEKPADAIEALVLVMSNHSQTPTEHLRGDFWDGAGASRRLRLCQAAKRWSTRRSASRARKAMILPGGGANRSRCRSLKSSSTGSASRTTGSTFQSRRST